MIYFLTVHHDDDDNILVNNRYYTVVSSGLKRVPVCYDLLTNAIKICLFAASPVIALSRARLRLGGELTAPPWRGSQNSYSCLQNRH